MPQQAAFCQPRDEKCGLAAVWWTSATTDISFLWYNLVGCFVTVAAGLLVTRLIGNSPPNEQRHQAI